MLSTAFGNLGRLAELEKKVEPLAELQKAQEIRLFFQELRNEELLELIPKASDHILYNFFLLFRTQVEAALDRLSDPLKKGKRYFAILHSLPKRFPVHQKLLGKCTTLAREAVRKAEDPALKIEAHYFLSEVLESEGKLTAAISESKKALSLSGVDHAPSEYYDLGLLYFRRGKPDDIHAAKKYFEMAKEADPSFQPAYFQLSLIMQRAGDLDGALTLFEELESQGVDLAPQISNEIGNLHKMKHELLQGQIFSNEASIAELKEQIVTCSESDSELLKMYEELARRYEALNGLPDDKEDGDYLPDLRKKNTKRISELHQMISDLMPNINLQQNPPLKDIIETFQVNIGIYQKIISGGVLSRFNAIQYYRKALAGDKPYRPAHMNLARVYLGMSRYQLSFREYQSAIDAGVNIARFFLGRHLILLDNHHQNVPEGKQLIEEFIRVTEETGEELSVSHLQSAKEILSQVPFTGKE
jgi:tetratricopeptide (TPR) repeat protein